MVLTTISSVALPVEEVEFPAVTICTEGMSIMSTNEFLQSMVSLYCIPQLFS